VQGPAPKPRGHFHQKELVRQASQGELAVVVDRKWPLREVSDLGGEALFAVGFYAFGPWPGELFRHDDGSGNVPPKRSRRPKVS
jgi:hypothetical protein